MNSNDEWYTPEFIMDKVRRVLGEIDLDPASNPTANTIVRAKTYYTKEQNGLNYPWLGKVWCNPPYSAALIKKFTKYFAEEYKRGVMTEGIMLTNSGTDTQWNIALQGGVQAYTNGRISFLQPDLTPKGKGSRGQCFTYFGPNPELFIEVFTEDNFCWVPNLVLMRGK
ncbi:DNA modification methyltransferase [Vibrio phage JSF12]|uniref:DNA modification methyltransferase n=2 Tax=Jesfedecavirus TaxID=2560156 RepID=A0A2D0YXB0_9CAUD|nr:DNA modification methyltransferase [Vibrio phage JSF10]YP_009794687.1 DNA modification methyltransferase [Vibrio phage JSF12]ASV43424.1 DNA modification methyltransferase [Vibrio phage JSF10]ASV43522.1 DNA modification methyltransferase [Vibrio phage JSF12]